VSRPIFRAHESAGTVSSNQLKSAALQLMRSGRSVLPFSKSGVYNSGYLPDMTGHGMLKVTAGRGEYPSINVTGTDGAQIALFTNMGKLAISHFVWMCLDSSCLPQKWPDRRGEGVCGGCETRLDI
jgi:hypothetical protein